MLERVATAPVYPDWTAYDGDAPRGRDFLGLQSVGDAMLDFLLPGMTNATRHPRYYAFFCWVFRKAHERRLTVQQTEELRFRYETVLVYAAKAAHARDVAGIVGIRSVERGETIWRGLDARYPLTKEQWGDRASAFSPPVYGPSFVRLGLLARAPSGAIALLPAGQRLAEAYERGLKNLAALKLLETRKTADGEALRVMHDDLCPCAVRLGGRPERSILVNLLFRMEDGDETARGRRRSLAFLLDLVAKAGDDFPRTDDELRTLLYFRRFPNGRRYKPPKQLAENADGWRLFQTRQYQRYAIEALWVAYLRLIARTGVVPFLTHDLVGSLDLLDPDVLLTRRRSPFAAATAGDVARRLQLDKEDIWVAIDVEDKRSEAQWKARIDMSLDEPELLLTNALGLLLTLWARWRVIDDAKAQIFLAAGGRGRLSVASLLAEIESRIDLPLPALLAWLLEEYAVAQHMRVATNKLRVEGLDTFWFVAQEDGYALHPERDIAKARPGYNAPKLWAALSSLFDLRLVGRDADGAYASTTEGERMLQRILDVE